MSLRTLNACVEKTPHLQVRERGLIHPNQPHLQQLEPIPAENAYSTTHNSWRQANITESVLSLGSA